MADARATDECVCDNKHGRKCRYHAMYPEGRPYEPGLITPFLNMLHRMDRENRQRPDEELAEQ